MEAKSKKLLLLTGAARFNKHPKGGIAFLEEHDLIRASVSSEASEDEKTAARAQSIAYFLKNTPRLDKKLLGEFIAKPENIDILKAFIGFFDFDKVCAPLDFLEHYSSFKGSYSGGDEGDVGKLSTARRGAAN